MRILITGANAPGTAGTAWSLLRPGLFEEKPELLGTDVNPAKPNRYLGEIFQIPKGNDDRYIAQLQTICETNKIDLIVPQTTAETISISQALKQLEKTVSVAILKPSEKVSQLISKVKTFKLISNSKFCSQNFEIFYSREELKNYITLNKNSNFFLKANSLSGGRGIVSVVSSFSDLLLAKPGSFHSITIEHALKAFDSLITNEGIVVQKSVNGVEYSIDCYRDQRVQIAIPRRRDRIRSGISQETTVVRNQKLIDFAMSFGEALNLQGVFGIQCIQNQEGEISFLECNPRIQGTMVASTFANENLIGRGARLALELESEPAREIKWGTKYSRSSGGRDSSMEYPQKFSLKPWVEATEFEQKLKEIAPNISLILFDLDETLFSHRQFVLGRLQYALEVYSNQTISETTKRMIYTQIDKVGTNGIIDFVINKIDSKLTLIDLTNALRTLCPLDESDLIRPKLKPLFEVLISKFEIGICTNGNVEQQKLKVGILEQQLNNKLNVHYCEQIQPKPSPECLMRALGEKSSTQALFIGDSIVDAEAAELADIRFINANSFESKS